MFFRCFGFLLRIIKLLERCSSIKGSISRRIETRSGISKITRGIAESKRLKGVARVVIGVIVGSVRGN